MAELPTPSEIKKRAAELDMTVEEYIEEQKDLGKVFDSEN